MDEVVVNDLNNGCVTVIFSHLHKFKLKFCSHLMELRWSTNIDGSKGIGVTSFNKRGYLQAYFR